MAGNKEGARKAALTNIKKYGKDFYKEIGSRSWDDPTRSRKTGFALLSPEKRAELGRKGGKKKKNEYKTTNNEAKNARVKKAKEDLQWIEDNFGPTPKAQETSSGVSE